MRSHVSADHAYVIVSMPPQGTTSRVLQRMQGKSASLLFKEFSALRKRFWGRHVWIRGSFCRASGSATDEVSEEYIEPQDHNSHV